MNKIRCKHCNDIIESRHRHDFVTCKCGAVSVDGGDSYGRRLWPSGDPDDHFEEMEDGVAV